MADIVTRLRMEADQCDLSPCDCQCPNLIEAADEIERLRAAGDALVALIDGNIEWDTPYEESHADSVIAAWEEARRG